MDAVAYVNEQEWSGKWYSYDVGCATVKEAETAVEDIKTLNIGKTEIHRSNDFDAVLILGQVAFHGGLGFSTGLLLCFRISGLAQRVLRGGRFFELTEA